jgi:hypothetical protein
MLGVMRSTRGSSMKNIFLVTVLALGLNISAFADIIYPDGSKPFSVPYEVKKFARGLNSVVMAPMEIPKSLFDATADYGVLSVEQVSYGLFTRAPYKTGMRFASGVYDLGTFLDGDSSLVHLEPDFIGPLELLPGLNRMFSWDTIETGSGSIR